MLFAKCVPHSIEGLMVGLVNSIFKFNTEILARLYSLFLIRNLTITYEDYEGLSDAMYAGAWLALLLPVLLFKFLTDRKEFTYV
jgi:hypothetical protein